MSATGETETGEVETRSLAELRDEIDAIDAEMHRLLLARASVIDSLIKTKGTGRPGAAFRPGREADMMRRFVARHSGTLPLTTVEHIWREIISTFTHMQAPFGVAIDLSIEPDRMRDLARFYFGFSVDLIPLKGPAAVIDRVAEANDLGLIVRDQPASAGAWWRKLVGDASPRIMAILPHIGATKRPADLPAFVISPPLADPTAPDIRIYAMRHRRRRRPPAPGRRRVHRLCRCQRRWTQRCAGRHPRRHRSGYFRHAGAHGRRLDRLDRRGWRHRLWHRHRRTGLDALSGRRSERHRLMSPTPERPTPRQGVLDIAPYIPGKSAATGGTKLFKLSSNETPFGASPMAIEAYRELSDHLERYPDGAATALREAIGRTYGLNPDRIVCGAGSDEVLNLLAHAYIGPGDEAIHTEHGFLVYAIAIRAAGGTPVVAPETEMTASVDAILERVTPRTRIVFLANPNNPTGTYLPFSDVRRLHAALPSRTLLVLDAAYAEYVRRNDYESGMELAATAENVVMTRTFSKIYGLAGLRIGWCYGPAHLIDALNRIRGPFNLSAPAIAAGVAALADRAHVERSAAHNEEWVPKLTTALEALGLRVTPSVGNFILIRFADAPTAHAADEYLLARGIVLRRVEAYGLPDALRMTVGSAEANEATIAALREFLSQSKVA